MNTGSGAAEGARRARRPPARPLPPTRRTALAAVGALAALALPEPAEAADELRRVCEGDGDPRHALAGVACVSLVAGSGGVREAAFGRAHIAPDRPLRVDSPVRVASLSKHVTAIGVMQLVEQGRFRLDDDASDLVGFRLRHPSFPGARVTPRRLLSHTSGLRNGRDYPVPFGRRLADALAEGGEGGWWGPAEEPPGWFHYADVNFACLAQAIEHVSGDRFDLYMRERVLRPLGLDAGYNWSGVSQAARGRAATLYRKGVDETRFDPDGPWRAQVDDPPPPAPQIAVVRAPDAATLPLDRYRPGENGFVFAPHGGLRASARDLFALARMMANGGGTAGRRLLRPETVAAMQAPVWRYDPARPNGEPYGGGGILAYGLGTCLLTGREGPQGDALFPGCAGWAGHLGEAYGLLSGLWVDPRTGSAMAYVITGVSSGHDANRGRHSAYTWQEERVAAELAPLAPLDPTHKVW